MLDIALIALAVFGFILAGVVLRLIAGSVTRALSRRGVRASEGG